MHHCIPDTAIGSSLCRRHKQYCIPGTDYIPFIQITDTGVGSSQLKEAEAVLSTETKILV